MIITNDEINKLVDHKLETIAKEANLPGFRPGKVPVAVVKNRFGKQVLGNVALSRSCFPCQHISVFNPGGYCKGAQGFSGRARPEGTGGLRHAFERSF